MIVRAAAHLEETIAVYTRLQASASQVESVRATSEALGHLQKEVRMWFGCVQALTPLLSDGQRATLAKNGRRLHQSIAASKGAFATNLAQAEPIMQARQLVKRMLEELQSFWRAYTEERLSSFRNQVRLAHHLPTMRASVGRIDERVAVLEKLAQRLPEKAGDVGAFHQQLAELESDLKHVGDLGPEQAVFLEKLLQGTAKLGDVTDSLLIWCRQEGLATLLKVTL